MVACGEVNSLRRGRRHGNVWGKEAVSAQLKATHSMREDYVGDKATGRRSVIRRKNKQSR